MPTAKHAALRDLRMKYNAANAAYQACVKTRTEITMSGAALSPAQGEKEAAALLALDKLRGELMAAIAETAGQSPAD